MILTILTPTYNRAATLKRLWNSLQRQTIKEFQWLVVDDGSTDNTESLIREFSANSLFPVKYILKENGGKHTALNRGIEEIDSELTFIVDSDDWLPADSVELILKTHKRFSGNQNICGYSFLRQYPDGKINGKTFRVDCLIASYIDARINSDDTHSDKAEVFLTKCLREYPFPEFSNEKFLGEDIVWIRMARQYKMVYINQPIYIGDYLSDGLTNTRRRHNIASPLGCMYRAVEFTYPDIKLAYRIKGSLQLIAYGLMANYQLKELMSFSKSKLLTFALIPGGFLLSHIWSASN